MTTRPFLFSCLHYKNTSMNKNSNVNERIDDLIVKSLGLQITPKEEEELHAWISASEENHRYFIEMQYLWKSAASRDKIDFNSIGAFQRFKVRAGLGEKAKEKNIGFYLNTFLRYAAIVVLAFALGGLSYYFVNNRIIQNNTKEYSINVPNGAKTKIELPDKSVVFLNAGSSLHFSQNFGEKSRNVELKGEGYFEIAHNPAKPFIVHTSQASVRVLGTKFDVKAYPDEKKLNVTLLKGSIQLRTIYKPGEVLMLKPNQSAIIDKEQQNVEVKQVVASDAAAWAKGKIIFDEVLFGNIVRRLERDYNVTIIVKNSKLNNLRFFGDFRNAQSIEEILNIMTADNEFRYTMKGNVITVYQ